MRVKMSLAAPQSKTLGPESSRKLKRKQSRKSRKQNKHEAWLEHQVKVRKHISKPTMVKTPEVVLTENDSEEDDKQISNEVSSWEVNDEVDLNHEIGSTTSKKKKKKQKEKEKKKRNETDPEGYVEIDTEENSEEIGLKSDTKTKSSKMKKDKGTRKRKKTKFEEYLEMEMNKGMPSAKEDLELEKRLAKKLKVKGGKLRGGDDDEFNLLFGEMPSIFELSEHECESNDEIDDAGWIKKKKAKKSKKINMVNQEIESSEGHAPSNLLDQNIEPCVSKKEVDGEVKLENDPTEAKQIAKYVAPHLRACSSSDSKELIQMRRRVRGLLNRLSESNVESITGEISSIFQSFSRSDASQLIGEAILASCIGGPRGNEQYAAAFAAFVAGLACMVGIDFGAKLLASLAKSFEDEYQKEDNLSLRNVTLLFCYLCIFGVCSSDLVYDFLTMLANRLTEVDVATILTVLQCCGMKLRSDDPVAMKDFILNIQKRVSESKDSDGDKANSKRMEFMLETICDIKNNKRRKEDIPQHTRVKKWLQKLRVDDVMLRGLKWKKLLDPNKKGQWWLSHDIDHEENVNLVARTIDKEVLEAQKMVQLAAAQRMNTDTRKAIFCVIMTGEDYVDAFEKLLRLNLQGKQDRDIMRVLLLCCLQEKVFNKYYTALAAKLCGNDKNHKFTLQYCIWDQYKELDSMQLLQSMHLAKFVAEMLSSFSLSLAVLKVVNLSDPTQLTPKRIMHFRMFFEAVFENSDSVIWNIFTRIAVAPELEESRTGMLFFMKEYVVPNNKSTANKFKLVKKALNNVEGVLM